MPEFYPKRERIMVGKQIWPKDQEAAYKAKYPLFVALIDECGSLDAAMEQILTRLARLEVGMERLGPIVGKAPDM